MQRFHILSLFVLLTVCFGVEAPAHAGKKEDIEALRLKTLALESQIASLTQQTGQTDADATLKISQLQRENQQLTGQVETLSNEVRQMRARLDQVTRVLAGESFSGLDTIIPPGAPPAATAPGSNFGASAQPGATQQGPGQAGVVAPLNGPVSDDPTALGPVTGDGSSKPTGSEVATGNTTKSATNGVQLPADPNEAYAYASNFLLTGDYIKARQAFELYVQSFPKSVHTPDARFRLGEIYLATGANTDAAQAFIGHIRDYPSDPKSAEAHLKLGTSFARMKQTTQACQIYKQVRIKFPNASQIVLSRTELEMQRIDCR